MVAILKTTQIQEPSSATVNLTLDTSGGVTVGQNLTVSGNQSATGTVAMGSSFLRNRIINGDMRIDQRNAGAAQSITTASAYTVDRWLAIPAGASVTGQRSSGTLSQYNYRFTGASLVTQIQFQQRIESVNVADLAGKTVTVSVNLSNSLLTAVGWQVWNANSVDNFAGITLVSSGSITVSSTETNYTFSVTLPAGATNGIMLNLFVGAQTSGTWTVGNVQLEQGTVATPFERRLYGQEVSLCQRYYCKTFSLGTAPGNNITSTGALKGASRNGSTTEPSANWKFPVSMRTEPTVTLYNTGSGTAGQWSQDGGATSSANARSQWISTEGCAMDNTGTAFNNVSNIQAAASAEL